MALTFDRNARRTRMYTHAFMEKNCMKSGFFYCWLLSLLVWTYPATAQNIVCPKPSDDPERNKSEARRYFQMGDTYFNVQDYASSIASFSCVISLVPYSVMARYRLAQSHDRLGQLEEALRHYQWIAADTSPENEALRAQVKQRMEEIRTELEKRKTQPGDTTPPGAGNDGKTNPDTENPAPEKPGPTNTQPAGTQSGSAATAPADIPLPTRAAAASSPSLLSRWGFWAGAGATLALAGATTWMGLYTLDLRDQLETEWNTADRNAMKRSRTLTDVLLAATLASGAIWGWFSWKTLRVNKEVREQAWRLMPACEPHACTLTLSFGF